MIRLSNGHTFSYIAASGALAYDGSGWPWGVSITVDGTYGSAALYGGHKTLTYLPRKGIFGGTRPGVWYAFSNGGAVNAIGPDQPGVSLVVRPESDQAIDRVKIPIIVSNRVRKLRRSSRRNSSHGEYVCTTSWE